MNRAQRARERDTITPRAAPSELGKGTRFLIVVEGEQTERRYFEELCGKLRYTAAEVVVKNPDTDPFHLVESAISLRDKEIQRAKDHLAVEFDQIWVVCDRETKHNHREGRLAKACQLAQKEKIHIALSIPCFEFWLLLHQSNSTEQLHSCEHAEKHLSELQTKAGLPAYDKVAYPLDFYIGKEQVTRACKNADRVRSAHENADIESPARYWARDYIALPKAGSSPDGDPCTDVDELVRQLNLATHPGKRLILYHLCGSPEPFVRR